VEGVDANNGGVEKDVARVLFDFGGVDMKVLEVGIAPGSVE
jgi:hypothetical protein